MNNFLNIGYNSISLSVEQVEKYNKIISWEEYIWLSDWDLNEKGNEVVEVFLFKTRRSYYIRFATTLLTGSPVVITKELGLDLDLNLYCSEDEYKEYNLESQVINLQTLKENSNITNSSKRWEGLPSYFCDWQHSACPKRKIGPSNFKTISFNLHKEYMERNKKRFETTKAVLERVNGKILTSSYNPFK